MKVVFKVIDREYTSQSITQRKNAILTLFKTYSIL